MEKRILIMAGEVKATAVLNNTKTAEAIWQALPITGRANLWGEEIYFAVPLKLELEAGQEIVSEGDLGYWPEGCAFCIFCGRTPISQGDEIRTAGPVTVFGKLTGHTKVLKKVRARTKITVRRENHEQGNQEGSVLLRRTRG